MSSLLPSDKKLTHLLPRREPFEVLYRLNCDNLCSDFKEDITFKFSFGFTALINKCLGARQGSKISFFGSGGPEPVNQ
jgi:mitofusin